MRVHILLAGLLVLITGCAAEAASRAAAAGTLRPSLGIAAWAPERYPGLALAVEQIAINGLRAGGQFTIRHARIIEDSWREACGGVDEVMELRIRHINPVTRSLSLTATLYDCSTEAMCWQVLGTSGDQRASDASIASQRWSAHLQPEARSWAPQALAAVRDVLGGVPESDTPVRPPAAPSRLTPGETAALQSRSAPPAAPSSAP